MHAGYTLYLMIAVCVWPNDISEGEAAFMINDYYGTGTEVEQAFFGRRRMRRKGSGKPYPKRQTSRTPIINTNTTGKGVDWSSATTKQSCIIGRFTDW